jgi:hypothetical protein
MGARGHPHFHFLLSLGVLVCLKVAAGSLPLASPSRLPLQKKNFELGQPVPVSPEFEGYDNEGKPIYWDPRPRVVPLGRGRYAFKWFGRKGRELTLIYERPDAVDVIVEASVATSTPRSISYLYKVRVMDTSGVPLIGFVVQTFSPKVKPVTNSTTFAGKMAGFIREFSDGNWIRFAPFGGRNELPPGRQADFALVSPDLPGLVACRVHGGSFMVEGVGEEPPTALENLYLGHDAWPHGYTIGPDERLAKMSLAARLKYLVERLPQMLQLGWIENQKVMQWYGTNLKAGKVA